MGSESDSDPNGRSSFTIVYEVGPLECTNGGAPLRVTALIKQANVSARDLFKSLTRNRGKKMADHTRF